MTLDPFAAGMLTGGAINIVCFLIGGYVGDRGRR